METLEKSRMCRLCGKQSGIAIDIFDKNESHVRKINAILPILVHEMDFLPKQMCHRCSYKLEEFYNFYVACAKTDKELKSQLSWMSKEGDEEKNSIPMVKMNKFKIKTEPLDNDSIDPHNAFGKFGESSLFFPASILQHGAESNLTLPCLQCKCVCNSSVKINKTSPKPIKVRSRSMSENKAHNSQIIGNGPCVLIEPIDIDYELKCSNNLFKNSKFNQINSSEKTNNNTDNGVVALDIDDIKSENRALRPRKSSIDYVGPKRNHPTNLKTNVKNKLDDIDMSLVNPVDMKITHGNAYHPSPIIKLEKVDDPVKSLRAQKNLEIFNKRVRELQQKKNIPKKETSHRKSFWTEAHQSKKKHKLKESPSSLVTKTLRSEENGANKNVKIEHELKCNIQPDGNMNGEYSNNDLSITESKIKEEQVNNAIICDQSSKHSVQENALKPVDRFPFCAVVKLEKDYTCNVDYPKIQIKRHLTVSNSMESQEGCSKVSEQHDHAENIKKSPNKSDFFLKNLRNSERRMKIKNNHHKMRSRRKNGKQLNANIKQAVFKKELSMVFHPSELKYYCEQCNTSFGNKELYKLHPCYQN